MMTFMPETLGKGATLMTMRALHPLIHEFYEDPENERKFQIWKAKKEEEAKRGISNEGVAGWRKDYST